jgi:hypothetical protein
MTFLDPYEMAAQEREADRRRSEADAAWVLGRLRLPDDRDAARPDKQAQDDQHDA